MKKWMILLLIPVLLTGCANAEVFETLGQIQHESQDVPTLATVQLTLPESAVAETFGGTEAVYECDGYTLVLQNLPAGDLGRTIRTLSGYSPEQLTVLESGTDQVHRYDWVWTAVGESGDLIFRCVVLDDGGYHYCLYTFAPAEQTGTLAEAWNALFASFQLGDAA